MYMGCTQCGKEITGLYFVLDEKETDGVFCSTDCTEEFIHESIKKVE